MTKEFFWEIYSNQYYIHLSFCFAMTYVLVRPMLNSVLHPIFFYYIFNYSFAWAAVSFLYAEKYISYHLWMYFFLAQAAFILGLYSSFFFASNTVPRVRFPKIVMFNDHGYDSVNGVYIISVALFFAFTFATYLFFGLPVLEGSRWELYKEIPGAGLIGRIIDVAKFCMLFHLTYKYLDTDSRFTRLDYIVAASLLITGFFSGSKMAVFEYVFISYCSYLFIRDGRDGIRTFKLTLSVVLILFVAVFASLFVVYINQLYVNGVHVNPIELLLRRFVMSGDLQIMAYSNDVLNNLSLSYSNLGEALFFDLKTLFSVFGIYFGGTSLGAEVMYYNYPYLRGVVNMGPASTFETFWYFVLGPQRGLLSSFVTGLIIGGLFFIKRNTRSLASALFRAALAFSSIFFIYNPQVALGKMIFIIFYLVTLKFVLGLCFVISVHHRKVSR